MHIETLVVMVLFEGCDIELIQAFANSNGLHMECFQTSANLLEKNYLFKIRKRNG
jgi:release factor glutamine methyltransferase